LVSEEKIICFGKVEKNRKKSAGKESPEKKDYNERVKPIIIKRPMQVRTAFRGGGNREPVVLATEGGRFF